MRFFRSRLCCLGLLVALAAWTPQAPAFAAGWHGGYGHWHGHGGWGGWGPGLGFGLLGGALLGAGLAGAFSYPYAYAYPYPYAYGYGYGPGWGAGGCIRYRPVYDGWGYYVGRMPVDVCQ